jgi:ADP-ribose pyrophosphatase YjhB (NUDIX family)
MGDLVAGDLIYYITYYVYDMLKENDLREWVRQAGGEFLSHISLDCAVFGFHAGQLKILLLKMRHFDQLSLPGGFVIKQETLEDAAIRTLKERTGLGNIFLQQFHVFSDPARSNYEEKVAS